MSRALAALLLLVVAACTNVPQAPSYQQTQSACSPNTENTWACQVERYNSIGTQ